MISFEEFCKPFPEGKAAVALFSLPTRDEVCYLSVFFEIIKTGKVDEEALFHVPVKFRGGKGSRFGFIWKFVVLDDAHRETNIIIDMPVEGRGIYLKSWYFAVLERRLPQSLDKYASRGH